MFCGELNLYAILWALIMKNNTKLGIKVNIFGGPPRAHAS
jgi:hypothetical protein